MITKPKFTPAPWLAIQCSDIKGEREGCWFVTDGNIVTICDVNNIRPDFPQDHPNYSVALEEQAANAALISAAPDMYQELLELVSMFEAITKTGDPIFLGDINRIEGILAKARGEQ